MKSKSEISQENAPAVVVSRPAKTHEDYWNSRIRRRSFRNADGTVTEMPEWQVQLGRGGRQRWIQLGTANKTTAAKLARDAWLKLKTQGWDAVKPERERIIDATVGEYLDAVRAESDLLPVTLKIYAGKLRRIVVGVLRMDSGRTKHDYHGSGYKDWRARIDAVKLTRLTPEAVQHWKMRYIAAAAAVNPLQERRARRTLASVLRSAKALFTARIVSKLHMELPDPLPLVGVDVPRTSPVPYVSKIEPMLLFQQAEREMLQPTDDMLRPSAEAELRKKESATNSSSAASRIERARFRGVSPTGCTASVSLKTFRAGKSP